VTHPAAYWIDKLSLSAHPEGGYYRETYRAADDVSTAIYYLLEGDQFSAFHRIQSDELWHFYAGSPLTVYVLEKEGGLKTYDLGRQPETGEVFQALVPAGLWFAAALKDGGSYALAGCTVAPGFRFDDFELADRNALVREYPQHQTMIEKLTKEGK